MAAKFKIRKGDRVVVISGRDKGRAGEVLKVLREQNRLSVQGVNMVKRDTKQSPGQTGGIVAKEGSIHVSTVAIADPKGGTATGVGYKFLDDGRTVRIARRSGEVIDQ